MQSRTAERRYTRVAEMQYTRVYNIQTTGAKQRCRADGQAERTADAVQSMRRQSEWPSGDAGRLRGRGGQPVDTSRVVA